MYSERCISWKRCEGQHEIHGEPKHDRFHSNVIVAHGVLQTFDRCRPFHETKFSRINVCTERFWNKIKIAQLFLSSLLFPWCKYIHLQVLKGKRCDFKTPTQKLSILNKQFVLDVNRCEWLQSYRGIALFVCFFACLTQIWIFAVNWHMDVCVRSGVDGDILLNQRLSVTDSQPSVVIVHVLDYFDFFCSRNETWGCRRIVGCCLPAHSLF